MSWPLPPIGLLVPLCSFTLFRRRLPNLFCTWLAHSNFVGVILYFSYGLEWTTALKEDVSSSSKYSRYIIFLSIYIWNISMAPAASIAPELAVWFTEQAWVFLQLLYSGVPCRISQIWHCLHCFERTCVSTRLLPAVTLSQHQLQIRGLSFVRRHHFLARTRGMPLGVLEKKKQPHQLLFSYALQSWLLPICRIWNWIQIYASRKWLYCFQPSINFSGSNCSNIYFKHVPSLVFVWSCTLLGCIKVSFPVTNATKNCNFVCKTHSSFLIIYKLNCWLMTFWT